LSRASSVVKESFSKIDTSNNSDEVVPLLKTLLEGVGMTEKQLAEVFYLTFLSSVIIVVNRVICSLNFSIPCIMYLFHLDLSYIIIPLEDMLTIWLSWI
jgi:hypothetical protein